MKRRKKEERNGGGGKRSRCKDWYYSDGNVLAAVGSSTS